VAEHQNVFFHAAWAKYEEAVPGSLRLVPPEARLKEIERDYDVMRREMIFGDAPELKDLLEVLGQIETLVNGVKPAGG
jgi:hypothetical protein